MVLCRRSGRVMISTPVGMEVYKTAFPPGNTCGQFSEVSPCLSWDIKVGEPPAEGIRDKAPGPESCATILPSSPQLPPPPDGASHKITGAPPSTGTFFKLPLAKNAIQFPSGEKKGA